MINLVGIFLFIGLTSVGIVFSLRLVFPSKKNIRFFQKKDWKQEVNSPITCKDIHRNFFGMTTKIIWVLIFLYTFVAYLLLEISLIGICCVLGLEVICCLLLSFKNYRKTIIKRTKKHFKDIADIDKYIDDVIQDINENLIGIYRNRFILSKNYVIICDSFGPVAVPRDRIQKVSFFDGAMLCFNFWIDGKKQSFSLGRSNNLSQGAAEKLLEYLGKEEEKVFNK